MSKGKELKKEDYSDKLKSYGAEKSELIMVIDDNLFILKEYEDGHEEQVLSPDGRSMSHIYRRVKEFDDEYKEFEGSIVNPLTSWECGRVYSEKRNEIDKEWNYTVSSSFRKYWRDGRFNAEQIEVLYLIGLRPSVVQGIDEEKEMPNVRKRFEEVKKRKKVKKAVRKKIFSPEYSIFEQQVNRLYDYHVELYGELVEAKKACDKELEDLIGRYMVKNSERITRYIDEFVEENPDSRFAKCVNAPEIEDICRTFFNQNDIRPRDLLNKFDEIWERYYNDKEKK